MEVSDSSPEPPSLRLLELGLAAELTHTGNSREWGNGREEPAAARLGAESRQGADWQPPYTTPPHPPPSRSPPLHFPTLVPPRFRRALGRQTPCPLRRSEPRARTRPWEGSPAGEGGRIRQSPQRRGGAESSVSPSSLWHGTARHCALQQSKLSSQPRQEADYQEAAPPPPPAPFRK